jgi:transcription antitermination factor NusG
MTAAIEEAVRPGPGVPPRIGPSDDPHWYAIYTCAHHERKVAEQFQLRSIEQFLPLYETVHRGKRRRVRLQLPLFPGYVFVRMSLVDQLRALQIPGVVRFVSFNGRPTPLPEEEMLALRQSLLSGLRAEPYPHLFEGRRVRVKAGPLCGMTGNLLRRKQNCRIVISIDSISRSIVCEVSLDDLEGVDSPHTPQEDKRKRDTASIQSATTLSARTNLLSQGKLEN